MITIKLINGHLTNHVEVHEYSRCDLSLQHNMKYIFMPLDEIWL